MEKDAFFPVIKESESFLFRKISGSKRFEIEIFAWI
jgi:hypothetical protein